MRRALASVVAVLALCPAAVAHAGPRIVGGDVAAHGEFPWMAGLFISEGGAPAFRCGASLIAARWLVTAAHCVDDSGFDATKSFAVLGATNLAAPPSPAQTFSFTRVLLAPGYAATEHGHDAAVIELARPVAAPQVRLASTAHSDDRLFRYRRAVTALGWGYTGDPGKGGVLSTDALRQAALELNSADICRSVLGSAGFVFGDTELCAGTRDRGTCEGDSGGPLVAKDPSGAVLLGATSVGVVTEDGACNPYYPTVFSCLGCDPLHAFVEQYVPHVGINPVVNAYAGRPVLIRGFGHAPTGTGPFQGYDHLAWDFDGDGAFDDATDVAGARWTFKTAGVVPVAPNGTDAAGDNETRTLRVLVSAPARVSFAKPVYHLRNLERRHPYIRIQLERGAFYDASGKPIRGSYTLRVSGHGHTASMTVKGKYDPYNHHPYEEYAPPRRLLDKGFQTVRLTAFNGGFAGGRRTSAKLSLSTR